MPVSSSIDFLNGPLLSDSLKIVILIFFVFYVIFSLIIVRQVDLMSKSLITPVSPVVRAISIINAGLAIGFIILFIGVL